MKKILLVLISLFIIAALFISCAAGGAPMPREEAARPSIMESAEPETQAPEEEAPTAPPAEEPPEESATDIVAQEVYGLVLSLPSNIQTESTAGPARLSIYDGDNKTGSITIIEPADASGITNEDYISLPEYEDIIWQSIEEAHIVNGEKNKTQAEISGIPAMCFTYKYTIGESLITQVLVSFIHNGSIYQIYLETFEDSMDANIAIFEKLLKTISFA